MVHLSAAVAGEGSFEGVGADNAELAGHKDSARCELAPMYSKRAALHIVEGIPCVSLADTRQVKRKQVKQRRDWCARLEAA